MKITSACSVALFCFLVLAQSCNKKSGDNFEASAQPDLVVNASVTPGQAYIFTAGSSGTLGVARQASHYQVSQTGIDSENGSVIYTYKPAAGYTGSDEVSLVYASVASGNNNGGCPGNASGAGNTTTRMIVVKINVTN